MAKLLERPKFAAVIAFYRDCENAFRAAPPFGGIQCSLAFKGAASPAP
jgi:hypothetical protein